MKKKRGRPLTTGRYDTRQELEEMVWWFYDNSPNSIAWIAEKVQVSHTTASKILEKRP